MEKLTIGQEWSLLDILTVSYTVANHSTFYCAILAIKPVQLRVMLQ